VFVILKRRFHGPMLEILLLLSLGCIQAFIEIFIFDIISLSLSLSDCVCVCECDSACVCASGGACTQPLDLKMMWQVFDHCATPAGLVAMEPHTLKVVNNCTNIYSYLETSGGKSLNLHLTVVHFFNTSVD
jgi:hypothetical protein